MKNGLSLLTRRRYRIPRSILFAVAFVATQVCVTQRANEPETFTMVGFSSQKALKRAITRLMEARGTPSISDNEELGGYLDRISVCDVSDIATRKGKSFYYLKGSSPGFFMDVMKFSERAPSKPFRGNLSFVPASREIVCMVSSDHLGDAADAVKGAHYSAYGISFLTQTDKLLYGAYLRLHEGFHYTFAQLNTLLKKAFVKQGGDYISYNILDEANAYWQTHARFAMWEIDSTPEKRGAIGDFRRSQHPDTAAPLDAMIRSYGHDRVNWTIKHEGVFPTTINRLMLVLHIASTIKTKAYYESAAERLKTWGESTLNLDDVRVETIMFGQDYIYGKLPRVVDEVLASHPYLQYKSGKDLLDAFKADKNIPEYKIATVIKDVVHFLGEATRPTNLSDKGILQNLQQEARKLIRLQRTHALVRDGFVAADLAILFNSTLDQLSVPQKTAAARAQQCAIYKLVEQVRDKWVGPQLSGTAVSTVPAARPRAACG